MVYVEVNLDNIQINSTLNDGCVENVPNKYLKRNLWSQIQLYHSPLPPSPNQYVQKRGGSGEGTILGTVTVG